MIPPDNGVLLIAEPFLKDPNFLRTVVLLCEHQEAGTFGFVLNKLYDKTLDELMTEFEGHPIPVFCGGPVQMDSLHFLHQYPDIIPGGQQIIPGVYWGGNFETVTALIKSDAVDFSKIRFFVGYSGWGEGQLEEELTHNSWLTARSTRKIIFHPKMDMIWKDSIRLLGGDYEMMINFPTDPQLN